MHVSDQIAEEIIQLYLKQGGSEYAGEKVTQLEHMYQAASFAAQEGYDEEVILAAFLHDIGHICMPPTGENEMDGYGIRDHEQVGADFLRQRGFSERLVRLVGSHVEAKRYLTATNADYYKQLSEASKRTLEFQGGPMSDAEVRKFEADPLFELIVKMRLWDEAAKVEHQPVAPLDVFYNMIVRYFEHQKKQDA
jgi:phosphonate degradation associated HDIG domain protein